MKALRRMVVVMLLVVGITIGMPGISPGMSGDVNNDNTVNVFDALLVLQNAVGLYQPPDGSLFKTAADVAPLDANGLPGGDEMVNVFDALAILRHAVSLDSWKVPWETYGIGNFAVTVADGSISPSANAIPVASNENTIPADIIVQSYETNVTSGAKAYTLKIGATGFHTSKVGSVRLEVPFDANLVPDKTKIDSLHVLIRIFNADDKSVVDLTGQIVGNKIVAELTGLPSSATMTVLFNPNMAVVTSDPPSVKSTAKSLALTSETWATRKWAVVFDTVAVASEVKKFLGINVTPTTDQIKSAIKQQVADHAAGAAATYDAGGFRSPTLYVAKSTTEVGGDTYGATPRYLLHFQVNESNSFYTHDPQELLGPDGNHYGRVYIKETTINRKLEVTGGTIYMAIAHELFHAVQSGYDLMKSSVIDNGTTYPSYLNGVIEGTATAYGVLLGLRHDGDSATIPQVRQWLDIPGQIKAETLKLEDYFLNSSGTAAYANQDFFVYLARTIGHNDYTYLASLFEQLRLTIEDMANKQPNQAAIQNFLKFPLLEAVYQGVDIYLSGNHGTTLNKVHEDFARNRAVEHKSESLFGRPGETTEGLAVELFNNYPTNPGMKDVQIDFTTANTTTINDLSLLGRLSTRAVRIRPMPGKGAGDISITTTPNKGAFGTTVSGWLYRKESPTAAMTAIPLEAANTVTAFGADSGDEVILIMINPSFVTTQVGVVCEILHTKTTEQLTGTFEKTIAVASDTTGKPLVSLIGSGNWSLTGSGLQQGSVNEYGVNLNAAQGKSCQMNVTATARLTTYTHEQWLMQRRYVYSWHEPRFISVGSEYVPYAISGSATVFMSGGSNNILANYTSGYGSFQVHPGFELRYDLNIYDKNGNLVETNANVFSNNIWLYTVCVAIP